MVEVTIHSTWSAQPSGGSRIGVGEFRGNFVDSRILHERLDYINETHCFCFDLVNDKVPHEAEAEILAQGKIATKQARGRLSLQQVGAPPGRDA